MHTLHTNIYYIVQSYFLIELNILEIPLAWANPTGDLNLVYLSDGIDNTFSCKKEKVVCFDVVTEIKDVMNCYSRKIDVLKSLTSVISSCSMHMKYCVKTSPPTATIQG